MQRTLMRDASACFLPGELVALLGRNGAGKSTLMRAVAGLEPTRAGVIEIGGANIYTLPAQQRASLVSFVATERHRITNLKVEDLVSLGRAPYTNWLGRMQPEDREVVWRSLELVAMEQMAQRSVERLSDGELQRVMIARALAQQTPVILLDEPTAFLDMPSRYELIELLTSLVRTESKTIIFSTHELDIARDYCDTVALIDGCLLDVIRGDQSAKREAIERIFAINHVG